MDFNAFDQEQILSLLDIQNDGSIVIEEIDIVDTIKFVHISKNWNLSIVPNVCLACIPKVSITEK